MVFIFLVFSFFYFKKIFHALLLNLKNFLIGFPLSPSLGNQTSFNWASVPPAKTNLKKLKTPQIFLRIQTLQSKIFQGFFQWNSIKSYPHKQRKMLRKLSEFQGYAWKFVQNGFFFGISIFKICKEVVLKLFMKVNNTFFTSFGFCVLLKLSIRTCGCKIAF